MDRFMQWFEGFVFELARVLAAAGVPEEYQQLGALGLLYVGAVVAVLGVILVLLSGLRRAPQPAPAEPAAEEPEAEVAEVEAVADASAPVSGLEQQLDVAAEAEAEVPPPLVEPEAAAKAEPAPQPVAAPEPQLSLFDRFRRGLAKTQSSLVGRVDSLLRGRKVVDDELIEELEEILITADLGMTTTQKLIRALETKRAKGALETPEQVRQVLMEELRKTLQVESAPLDLETAKPFVIMVVGVNGVGKTTTIGKLANQFARSGKKVLLGAGDTFRAAAAEQLQVWGERAGVDVVRHAEGADPGAVAFDAAKAAVARKADVLILDTAGRLHTKVNLMEELKKVRRVLDREIPGAPHETLLVLDATTGQNALTQAKLFNEAVPLGGLALTKLDGTAKGGIVVAIAAELKVPVRYIGIGEGIDDLRPFDAEMFVAALFERSAG